MSFVRCLGLAALAAVLSSCADAPMRWENDALPQSAWSRDEDDCRRFAARQAEQDFDALASRRASTQGAGSASSFDRMEARANERRSFERCMTRRGYRRVPVEEEAQ